MFLYPIRHFLLSKLLMCAVQIDCGRMLISTHRKFEELFRKKPKVRKEAINALLIKPVIESIRCYYFSYFFYCNRHVRKKPRESCYGEIRTWEQTDPGSDEGWFRCSPRYKRINWKKNVLFLYLFAHDSTLFKWIANTRMQGEMWNRFLIKVYHHKFKLVG